MIEHQDDLDIDRNLNLLCESNNTSQFCLTNFINKNGKQMHTSNESKKFAELMVREGLIRVFGDFCSLERFGLSVFKKGGWLKYLSNQEKEKTELELKTQEKELLDTEIKILQKGKLEYEETIRAQNDRIRNLEEKIKFISLIKLYWWLIPSFITIGFLIAKGWDLTM
jgi:ERCC4-related helicase